jgi:hypothetical protein
MRLSGWVIMKSAFAFCLWIVLFPAMGSGNVIITGKIKNCHKSRITLQIFNTCDITFDKYEEKVNIEVMKDGSFRKELIDITCPHLTNFLDLGHKKIYFGYFPGDSICICFDYTDINNTLVFSGLNADKNYFIHNYLSLSAKESESKALKKMEFPDYKKYKETSLKNYLTLLDGYLEKYNLDTSYFFLQRQEIIFNFYNDVGTFDKSRADEPYLECYDTANLMYNIYMKDHIVYYTVLTGYIRYKYQAEHGQKEVATEFQPYYLAYNYLTDEVLEKYMGYFIMFQLTYNFSEQTIDNIKTIYFDYRSHHKDIEIYKMVTRKAIDLMLIRRNE